MAQRVTVVDYRPEWPEMYAREAAAIADILGENMTAIYYIGSTAVPGLAAKPIIDIMPAVTNLAAVDACSDRFAALGYECMGEFGIAGRRYFRKGGDERTHQVHVFGADNAYDIERHLAVRDYLRTHAERAMAYGQLKRSLAARFPSDIEAYCDGKDAFVKALERDALAWKRQFAAGAGHFSA